MWDWYRDNPWYFWLSFSGGAILMGLLWIGVTIFVSSTPTVQVATQQAPEEQKTAPDPPKVYDYNPPPIEVEYRKEFAEGEIEEVKFNGAGPYTEDKLNDKQNYHYVPDWTDVVYLPPGDDSREVTLQFCGNVLNKFDPHTKIKMMLHATNVGDYNDCFKSGAPLTFAGNPLPPSTGTRSSVPGSK